MSCLIRAKFPLVVGLALLIVTGCTLEKPSSDAAMNQDLHEFAARYTAAWCSQDPERVAAFFSENGSLTVNDGSPAVGRQAIAGVARGFMTTFPDMVVAMDSLHVQQDVVQYYWTLTGTNSGPEGTGRKVRIGGYEAWTMGEDDLIVASQGHFDEAEYRQQLEQGIEAASQP